jgi:hypothetical protein
MTDNYEKILKGCGKLSRIFSGENSSMGNPLMKGINCGNEGFLCQTCQAKKEAYQEAMKEELKFLKKICNVENSDFRAIKEEMKKLKQRIEE